MEAVDRCIDDAKQDRYKLIRDVLKGMVPREDGMLNLTELREAIADCSVMHEHDINDIILEVNKI